jgi:small-conductance mechanosensitive channel
MTAVTQLLAQRPELIALAICAAALAIVRSASRRLTLRRILLGTVFFLGFTYSLYQAHKVPYVAPVAARDPLSGFLGDALKAVWWIWLASLASETLRLYASRGHTPLARYRLSQDLSVGAIYICALIGLTTFVLNLPLQGLLVTSGAVAVILGLALQSALGDVFYGIVLSLGKPYQLGDWISIDNGAEGIVVEMNWRATHLLTDRQDIAIVPNSIIAKARIVNANYPSRTHGTTIRLPLAPQTPPELAVRVLSDAALACRLVLTQPTPTVVVKSMSAESTAFEVTFFTAEVGLAADAQTNVYDAMFRALRVAGILLGSNTAAATAKLLADAAAAPPLQRLLDAKPLFTRTAPDEREGMIAILRREDYEPGQILVQQGAPMGSLFIVGSGVLSLSRRTGNRVDELERFGPGSAFGCEELLKGTPARGSLTAMNKATVYRLEKAAFEKYVRRHGWDEESPRAPEISAKPEPVAAGENPLEWFSRKINGL